MDITFKFNDRTQGYDVDPADYQTLESAFILSANPDGTQIKIALSANVYEPDTELKNLQQERTDIEAKIQQATAAEADVQALPLTPQ